PPHPHEAPAIARDLRINERIRVREVLVIDDEGKKLGVIPIQQALDMAREQGLDLVEVAPQANPPVCRVLDYGKFKYEQAKKEREAHKHQKQAVLREVRFKPKIGVHDIDFKTRLVEKLLRAGDKVKVSVMFRGREITHPEIGRELLQRVAGNLQHVATVERQPAMEGRFMNMYLTPIPQKVAPKPREQASSAASENGAAPPAEGPADTAMAAAFEAARPKPDDAPTP
ncbi:MAG TPA: translation initiation factor IF-3, partial [Dehalococcoidia bacterium]|nr:translation initiation factor IF-3 [Dehalococcoidia bacterium]